MIQNFSIKTRLIGLIAFLAAQLIIGAAIGLIELGRASDEMHSMYNNRLVSLGQLDQVIRLLNRNELMISRAVAGSPEDTIQILIEIDGNKQKLDKQWTDYMATYLTPEEKQLAAGFTENHKKYLDEGLLPALSALRANEMQVAKSTLHGQMAQLFLPVRKSIDSLIQLQLDVAAQQYKNGESRYKLVRNVCIAGMVLGILLAALIGWWIVQGIVQPLRAAVTLANSVAAGDLTQAIEVRSKDETGQLLHSLKRMNENLVHIVGKVREGTDAIASASAQVVSGNLDLSSRTEQQASSLEETASSMEELTSTVKQSADNARQANELAALSRNVAVKGGEVVLQVIETMGAINTSSRKIADIISTIDGIAFQTNILALNAAVEAARAGEHGRGFAVVASEVRILAQRSANAAKEIKVLIEDSVNKVDAGSMLVNDAGGTMREIVVQVQRVTDVMAEMLAATQEQAAGIGQISQAVGQMDQVTQQNAALVEEAAAAADSLRNQADGLA